MTLLGALVLAVSLSAAAALAGRAVVHLAQARGYMRHAERETEPTGMSTMFRHEREPTPPPEAERCGMPVVALLGTAGLLTLVMIGLVLLS